jgi:hypothetical protein
LVKRSWALPRSNPTRDSQVLAGKACWPRLCLNNRGRFQVGVLPHHKHPFLPSDASKNLVSLVRHQKSALRIAECCSSNSGWETRRQVPPHRFPGGAQLPRHPLHSARHHVVHRNRFAPANSPQFPAQQALIGWTISETRGGVRAPLSRAAISCAALFTSLNNGRSPEPQTRPGRPAIPDGQK